MTTKNLCIAKARVATKPFFLNLGSRGPSKFEKHPIFDVFEGFSPITLVFLNPFTLKMAQNAYK